MPKILQARLQQYLNQNFQMYKVDLEKADVQGRFRKGREPETKLLTSLDHRVWGPTWETLKKRGQLLRLEAKMASGGRDRAVAYGKVFDWLS